MAEKVKTSVNFTKEAIVKSEKFKNYRDLLNAVLTKEYYSLEEVEKILQDEMKRKVN